MIVEVLAWYSFKELTPPEFACILIHKEDGGIILSSEYEAHFKGEDKTYFDATYGNIGLNYDQCPEVFLLDASSERYLFPTEDMLWCLFPDPRYHGKLLNSPAHPLHIPKNPLPL
jgi:hypothetical protein